MTSTDRRPSRPSTSGLPPPRTAWTKSASWRAWPWCEIAAGSLAPPDAPTLRAKRSFDRLVLGRLRREVPAQHVVLLDDGRAAVAVDRDRFRQAGINAGRRLDDAERPAGETQTGHGRVFHLDALVGQRGGEAGDVRDRTHQPEQEIDIVDRLIHQGAAAVERLRALPAALVVVRLAAATICRSSRPASAGRTAAVHGRLERPVGVAEARREDGAELARRCGRTPQ